MSYDDDDYYEYDDELPSTEEMMVELLRVKPIIDSDIELSRSIEITDDPEAIELYIQQMEANEQELPVAWRRPISIRQMIRDGMGDNKRIQEKCIRLGLV